MAVKAKKGSGIHIKPSHEGKFTAWVKANMPGTSVQEAARAVLAAKEGKYSPAVRRMANFARNAKGWG